MNIRSGRRRGTYTWRCRRTLDLRHSPASRISVAIMHHPSLQRLRFLAPVVLLATATAPLRAQTTPQKEVEILGVARTAVDQFKETVQKQCNGKYCMATLTGTLGYPAASVMLFQDGMVVAVLDPAQKDRIRYRAVPPGSGPLPASWRSAAEFATKEPMAFQAAVVGFAKLQKDGIEAAVADSPFGADEAAKAKQVWDFLGTQSNPGSRDIAAWTLANHAQPEARMLAAAVLMSFPEHDLTWWSLAEGLRDPNERVQGTCQQALQYLTRERAREVDWSPAVPALRAVLDGTHLGAVPGLARTLVATKVAPELAGALLAGAGSGVARLRAVHARSAGGTCAHAAQSPEQQGPRSGCGCLEDVDRVAEATGLSGHRTSPGPAAGNVGRSEPRRDRRDPRRGQEQRARADADACST
jgi:hypothetical protein